MRKREIVAIIALMIAGFVAYAVISQWQGADPDEMAPGSVPEVAGPSTTEPTAGEMKAIVAAARATELHAAMQQEHGLPDLPAEAGLLALAGNRGEFFFTRHYPGRAEVCVMRAAGLAVIWSTSTDKILELVGGHGSELLLKFIDEPFKGPADAWQPGGFYGLDIFAAGMGVYPSNLDADTVATIHSTIR